MAHTRCYCDGALTDEDFPLQDLSEHLEERGAVVWVDLCPPDASDLQLVADELGLHHLAVEDATTGRQRPKLDRYSNHDFLTAYAVSLDVSSGQLATAEIAVFITSHALITVRQDEGFSIEGLVGRWDESADLTKYGVSALLYGLLDFIVDGHFDTVQSLDEEIEKLEDLLFDDKPHDSAVQRRSFELRKSLVELRRVVLPMRDLVTTVLETNLTIQGNRLNIITKKVTSWAAIIAVPTAITGFYGQNVPYPGFSHTSGFLRPRSIGAGRRRIRCV